MGVPIRKTIVFWGLYWGPLILENYQSLTVVAPVYENLFLEDLAAILRVADCVLSAREAGCHVSGFRFRVWAVWLLLLGFPRQSGSYVRPVGLPGVSRENGTYYMIIGSILGLYGGHTGIIIPHSLLGTSKQEAHRYVFVQGICGLAFLKAHD